MNLFQLNLSEWKRMESLLASNPVFQEFLSRLKGCLQESLENLPLQENLDLAKSQGAALWLKSLIEGIENKPASSGENKEEV